MEGDETIEVNFGPIEGNAQAGPVSKVTVNILDGEAAAVDKMQEETAAEGLVAPAFFSVTEAAVDFVVVAFTFPDENAPPIQLLAEWSSDAGFSTDVNLLGVFDIPVFTFDTMIFLPPYAFSLPLNHLAAAVANNGFGGRGVAPGVALRGYNAGSFLADPQLSLLQSLGGSRSHPDSESVDIFNMSFGTVAPSQNSEEDFVRLMRMGTSELRSGRGSSRFQRAALCRAACLANQRSGLQLSQLVWLRGAGPGCGRFHGRRACSRQPG